MGYFDVAEFNGTAKNSGQRLYNVDLATTTGKWQAFTRKKQFLLKTSEKEQR